jgi:thiamine transport system permease protein
MAGEWHMTSAAQRFLTLFLVLLLLLPIGICASFLKTLHNPWTPEVAQVLFSTFAQASLSAAAALIFGLLGAYGILWFQSRAGGFWLRSIEWVAILPNTVPVLVLLLAVAKVMPQLRGFWGIVGVHAILNSGLLAVAIAQLILGKLGGMSELAYVEGAGRWQFFTRGVLSELRSDLMLLFLFVFAVCFSSFAVPLGIGGSRATTIEVLIFQKIRMSGNWDEATTLAYFQIIALTGFSFLLSQFSATARAVGSWAPTPLTRMSGGLLFVLAPVGLMLLGISTGIFSGLAQLRELRDLLHEIPLYVAGSVVLGLTSGCFVVLFLLALAFANPQGKTRRFLAGYAAPSSVLVGFAILLIWRQQGIATYFKIASGLTLVVVPTFYRYQLANLLRSLEGQLETAQTLGASSWFSFVRIVLPQIISEVFRLGGIAAMWAWGDFALSGVIAERPSTVAMAAQGLMSSYRLDGATVLIWFLMLGGIFNYLLFAGAGSVLGGESESSEG